MRLRVIIDGLNESKLRVSTSYLKNQEIGVNKNIDLGYYNISRGDPVISDVVIIEVEENRGPSCDSRQAS